MCLGLVRYQDKKILGNSSFLHYISVRKQGTILGGDISIVKVVHISPPGLTEFWKLASAV